MRPPGNLSAEEATAILERLVLRHLYDGDIVDYPLPDDHPDRPLFDGLERKGWIARWNRMWPLRDRYRLTERGIAEIERHYDPKKAEAVLGELKSMGLPPDKRGPWLRSKGYEPESWSTLHDPYTHWETWRTDPGPNFLYVHETARAARRLSEDAAPRRDHVEDLDRLARDAGMVHGGEPYGDVS
jgi:hypothetical protein